jgi:hypothetical protein
MEFPPFRNVLFLMDKVLHIRSPLIYTEVLGTTLIILPSILEDFWDL